MKISEISIGGWFQRTTLHLAEIYDFISEGTSPLALEQTELTRLRDSLDINEYSMEVGELETITFTTKDNVKVKIFEDGLITLRLLSPSGETKESIEKLTDYYENTLSPAISYIFSLGAPVPKELANIKTIYPYFVVAENASEPECLSLLEEFSQKLRFEIKKDGFEIYRGDKLFIINNKSEQLSSVERFIEEQVFMREFKGQLHRYLKRRER